MDTGSLLRSFGASVSWYRGGEGQASGSCEHGWRTWLQVPSRWGLLRHEDSNSWWRGLRSFTGI